MQYVYEKKILNAPCIFVCGDDNLSHNISKCKTTLGIIKYMGMMYEF